MTGYETVKMVLAVITIYGVAMLGFSIGVIFEGYELGKIKCALKIEEAENCRLRKDNVILKRLLRMEDENDANPL